MPGDETKNYDFVIELSEQGCDKIIGVFFNQSLEMHSGQDPLGIMVTASRLCHLLRDLGVSNISCEEKEDAEGDSQNLFSSVVRVLFDKPTDIPTLPSNAVDIVDIRMNLMIDKQSVGSLRIVAGMDVNHTSIGDQQIDWVRINLKDRTYFSNLVIYGVQIPGITGLLQGLGEIPIIPFPVNRNAAWPPASINDSLPVSVDARIIDDVSQDNRNAVALLLTFAGDTPGNRNAFTRSFVPGSGEGAMAINFNWICKMIRPQLAKALNTTESAFSPPCKLNTTITIDGGVDLTALELAMVEQDAIQVKGAVRKSGTGYSARGSLSAEITARVWSGRLIFDSHVDDPNIDIDLDWWVWLLAILSFGLILGEIGYALGAFTTWLATDVFEGALEYIAKQVVDAIKDLSLNVDLSSAGLDLTFLSIFLDDVIIGCKVKVTDLNDRGTPHLNGDGLIRVNPNEMIDLVNAIARPDLISGDIICELKNGWRIRALPHVVIARTDMTSFTDFNRYVLQGLQYERGAMISHSEMARTLPSHANLLGISRYQETGSIFAMRTRDGRYSLIQVAEMSEDSMTIRYRTFEKELPNVEVVGGFSYEAEFKGLTENILTRELMPKIKSVYMGGYGSQPQPIHAVQQDQSTLQPAGPGGVIAPSAKIQMGDVCGVMKSGPNRLPNCFGQRALQSRKAKFKARTYGLTPPVKVEWYIDDVHLDRKGGNIVTRGLQLYYTMAGDTITLMPSTHVNATFELAATVTDKAGKTTRAYRYVDFVDTKTENVRLIRSWGVYREEFWNAFGDLQATG